MAQKMKALRKLQPGPGLELVEIPVPVIKPNEVLIQVKKRAICGTDLHIYQWDEWSSNRLRPPLTVGHEFCGTIVEAGAEVRHYRVGELVSAEMHLVCEQCFQCRTGNAHLCDNVVILGVDGEGCFADFIAVPESNLWRVPPGVDEEIAAIYDPFGNAVHTVMAGATVGKVFLVIGGGPIGLAAIPIARAAGASRVILSEVQQYRRDLGEKMGADLVVDPLNQDLTALVMEMTSGQGVDVVLEMSGHPAAIQQGFKTLRKNGRYTLLGIPAKPISIDLAVDVIFPGIQIQGVNGRRMYETWFQMDALLQGGRLDLKPLITHRFAMEDFREAFAVGLSGQAGKIILT